MAYNAKIIEEDSNYRLLENIEGEYREVGVLSKKDLVDRLCYLRYKKARGEIKAIEVTVNSSPSENISFNNISDLINYLREGNNGSI